jgi:hypothetical protein
VKNTKKASKHKLLVVSARTMSDPNTVWNNELDVKMNFNVIVEELKAAGINFNKSLFDT